MAWRTNGGAYRFAADLGGARRRVPVSRGVWLEYLDISSHEIPATLRETLLEMLVYKAEERERSSQFAPSRARSRWFWRRTSGSSGGGQGRVWTLLILHAQIHRVWRCPVVSRRPRPLRLGSGRGRPPRSIRTRGRGRAKRGRGRARGRARADGDRPEHGREILEVGGARGGRDVGREDGACGNRRPVANVLHELAVEGEGRGGEGLVRASVARR